VRFATSSSRAKGVALVTWRYMAVRRSPLDARAWTAEGVHVEAEVMNGVGGSVPGALVSVEEMLDVCGSFGWELVALDRGEDGEVFYFKKSSGMVL
jgi:hypothetical protein